MALTAMLAVLHHRLAPDVAERIALHGTWWVASRETGGRDVLAHAGESIIIDGLSMMIFVQSEPERAPTRVAAFRLDAIDPKQIEILQIPQDPSKSASRYNGRIRATYERDGTMLKIFWTAGDAVSRVPIQKPMRLPRSAGGYTAKLVLVR
jgi:uncharacterized protein (TIGR03067 family)